jgi:hypothetical protein
MLWETGGIVVLGRGTEDLEIEAGRLAVAQEAENGRISHTGNTSGMPPRIGLEPSR